MASQDHLAGARIVDEMRGGRPWWRLAAGDVAGWSGRLPPAARGAGSQCMRAIGEPWDGRSDLTINGRTVGAERVSEAVHELGRAVAGLGVRPPAYGDVRQLVQGSGREEVAVDLDLGAVFLPIVLDGGRGGAAGPDALADVAPRAAGHVATAIANMPRVAAREERMRRAFEAAVGRSGAGAAPLWFRMEPVRPWEGDRVSLTRPFAWALVALDDRLDWSPHSGRPVWTTAEARSISGVHREDHRRRARASERLADAGLEGRVSEVAAALLDEERIGWREALAEARRLRRVDPGSGLALNRRGCTATIFYREGDLLASLLFDGGNYHDGQLSLYGGFPETVATASVGRRVSDLVDHPAFRSIGSTIERAEAHPGGMELGHRIQYHPIPRARP